jgi:hypothetical protein
MATYDDPALTHKGSSGSELLALGRAFSALAVRVTALEAKVNAPPPKATEPPKDAPKASFAQSTASQYQAAPTAEPPASPKSASVSEPKADK